MQDFKVEIEVGRSAQEMPFPYVLDGTAAEAMADISSSEIARALPATTELATAPSATRSSTGRGYSAATRPWPMALFDRPQDRLSRLARLAHYTGTPATHDARPEYILFTNYTRYVDEFVRWGCEQIQDPESPYTALSAAGNVLVTAETENPVATVENAAWRKHQMPAYHLTWPRTALGSPLGQHRRRPLQRQDHLRPPGGAAAAGLADDRTLRRTARVPDHLATTSWPTPTLRDDPCAGRCCRRRSRSRRSPRCKVALNRAAEMVTGETGDVLKLAPAHRHGGHHRRPATGSSGIRPARSGSSQEPGGGHRHGSRGRNHRHPQGYRFRVPYGTLLCVSDKPLHGNQTARRPGRTPSMIAPSASICRLASPPWTCCARKDPRLHSRKLRSFDEPPFR